MTIYRFIVVIVKYLVYLLNGKPIVVGRENMPENPSILAATHRSLLDPVYTAITFIPQEIAYMGKQSLFEVPIFGKFIPKINAFPINREKPSPRSLRAASDKINKENMHLGIYPTGSRYSTEVKGGTAFIQRLSKADIIPIAIQPPNGIWEFFLRKKAKIAIGKPIKHDPNKKYSRDELKEIDTLIAQQFDELDKVLDPDYKYVVKGKKGSDL